MGRNLELVLDQLDQVSLQISLTPDILDLLTRPFGQPAYQYAQIKEQLRSWMTSNPLFQSLYLEILQNRKILTTNEGIYDEAEFYDGAFMKQLQSSGPARSTPWVGLRKSGADQNLHKDAFLRMVMSLNDVKSASRCLRSGRAPYVYADSRFKLRSDDRIGNNGKGSYRDNSIKRN